MSSAGKSKHTIKRYKTILNGFIKWHALEEWLGVQGEYETSKLIVSQRKGLMTDQGVRHIFETLSKHTGIDNITPDVLRHTLGHDLADKNKPID